MYLKLNLMIVLCLHVCIYTGFPKKHLSSKIFKVYIIEFPSMQTPPDLLKAGIQSTSWGRGLKLVTYLSISYNTSPPP